MNDEKLTAIEQVKKFLEGGETLRFKGISIEGKISLDRVGAGEIQVSSTQQD